MLDYIYGQGFSGLVGLQYQHHRKTHEPDGIIFELRMGSDDGRTSRSWLMDRSRKFFDLHKLEWITTSGRDWIVDAEVLKRCFIGLADVAWLQGRFFVEPEYKTIPPSDFGSLGVPLPRPGTIALLIHLEPTTPRSPVITDQPPVEIQDSLSRFRGDHPDGSKLAFIVMRFEVSPAHEKITQAIRKTLEQHGMKALRADDKQYHDDTFWNILTYIYGSRIGIAVFERISTNDFNPNVSLEVGYMMGLRREVCLLKDKSLAQLQTDLIGKLYRAFDPQDIGRSIEKQLNGWLSDKGFV